jgi:hypothetical protein
METHGIRATMAGLWRCICGSLKLHQAGVLGLVKLLIAVPVALAPLGVLACGFHTKESLAKAFLNFTYPNALHVTGAIWTGQQAGILPMPDRERLQATGKKRKILDTQAYWKTTRALHSLGGAFDSIKGKQILKAVVLVETALWARYGGSKEIELHAVGAQAGDLVIVTGAPVLDTIKRGKLTISRALKSGYLRLYGTPEQQQAFLAAHGTIGESALPDVGQRQMITNIFGQPPKSAAVLQDAAQQ